MLHARIAARAFNTPLLVEPSKAMAFLSGLGPRILGRQVDIGDENGGLEGLVVPPARASILAGGMLDDYRQQGEAPYAVVDGIAVIEVSGVLIHRGAWIGQSSGQTSYEGIAAQIEAAASDPSVRGLALEIDSFGGEVAGVFDLADRIRAIRAIKPIWAFVAEHAFSAGYALASQADRILLPRTGAVGSIGVVVMHADLSGQLDQDGVRVTLIHAGSHKVDANPYTPLPADIQDDIQREIEVLRFLFAETVAAGRGAQLSPEAALATEAASFRGTEAVAAGLADEVIDLARGFASFRQSLSPIRASVSSRVATTAQIQSRKDPLMRNDTLPQTEPVPDEAQDSQTQSDIAANGGTDPEVPPTTALVSQSLAAPPAASNSPKADPASALQTSLRAELSAQLRLEAAEITEIAAQAGRLGVTIDAAKALREGTTPAALRRSVLEHAAAAADARDVVAITPAPAVSSNSESPIVAAAKRAAASGAKR
ncbi:S49 family peptidase [Paracoccaceae bacterium Fryx2]|nr:S49 family peptidase [Paracoccaceae bacterium Fryx2]MDT8858576.1 S49 family peptidase [Paracoccaceae bacterium Fryx2]